MTEYPTWLANVFQVPKINGNVRVYILIDNSAKYETQSFVDCFADYHQIEIHKDDAEKNCLHHT